MKLRQLTVGPVRTNCYIAYDDAARAGFVVDPGDDADAILREIDALSLKIGHIFLTHGHFDHILALAALKEATGARVYIHAADAPMLEDPTLSMLSAFMDSRFYTPVRADVLLHEGDVISAAGTALTVLHTPGHTPGSVCFDTGSCLFTGDTLFASSCGRTDFPGGDFRQMRASLRRLASLPGDRSCSPGHERGFSLDYARAHNPMLRTLPARDDSCG